MTDEELYGFTPGRNKPHPEARKFGYTQSKVVAAQSLQQQAAAQDVKTPSRKRKVWKNSCLLI
jgi:hypothetical protein